MEKRKVGEILLDAGIVDENQLEIALAEQKRGGRRLGRVLIDLGLATEEAISRALASQTGVDHYDLEKVPLEPAALQLIPEDLARRRQLVPLRIEDGTLLVAMANPTDIVAIDELERIADLFVQVVSASRRQVFRAIDRGYADAQRGEPALERSIRGATSEVESGEIDAAGSGVIGLLDDAVALAIRREATDLHLEPDDRVVRMRLRVDGGLVSGPTLPSTLLAPLVARIKILANLDISETRTPQDGKIRFPFETRKVDLRVSTFPTVHGESVVIRLLDSTRQQLNLDSLGIDDRGRAVLVKNSARPNGLILAVGPTGSGKTTTLYSLLRSINSSQRKVITLEDPVEYGLPLVTQCQIAEKTGLTFASGLRSILRHDPDVILVGEMRDAETAAMAVRAALTGHLVLSTLHTNDAVRTISRLADMNVAPFLVGSCLAAVVAQRLIRLLCEDCAFEYTPLPQELVAVGLPADAVGHFSRGKGCDRCNGTGSRGREAVFEILDVTPAIAQRISRGAPIDEIEEVARAGGMKTFREAAHEKALAGRIGLEEVARVTTEH